MKRIFSANITKMLITACLLSTPAVAQARPAECLLVTDGQTIIDGPCEFEMLKPILKSDIKGSFTITADGYFAQILRETKSTSLGFWNGERGSNHAHSDLGTLTSNGACWSNAQSKVCAWKVGERPKEKQETATVAPASNPAGPTSQFTVSAPQIWRDFYSNEVAASKKYMDATFTVTGTVLGVRYGRNNLIYAELNSSPMGDNVYAYFDKDASTTAESLKRGQEVSLTCFGAAKLTEIDLIGCR